jgi:hypothetical protein
MHGQQNIKYNHKLCFVRYLINCEVRKNLVEQNASFKLQFSVGERIEVLPNTKIGS